MTSTKHQKCFCAHDLFVYFLLANVVEYKFQVCRAVCYEWAVVWIFWHKSYITVRAHFHSVNLSYRGLLTLMVKRLRFLIQKFNRGILHVWPASVGSDQTSAETSGCARRMQWDPHMLWQQMIAIVLVTNLLFSFVHSFFPFSCGKGREVGASLLHWSVSECRAP